MFVGKYLEFYCFLFTLCCFCGVRKRSFHFKMVCNTDQIPLSLKFWFSWFETIMYNIVKRLFLQVKNISSSMFIDKSSKKLIYVY